MRFRRFVPVIVLACGVGSLLSVAAPSTAATPAADTVPRSLCAPPSDTVAPAATKVTFGRPTIDLDSGSRTQTVTVAASDASGDGSPSGVSLVRIGINGNRFGASPRLTLVSGTPTSGDWRGSFTVSKYAHPGTYSIYYIDVEDAAGNNQDYPGYGTVPDSPDAVSLHPSDNPTFTVTGKPATRPKPKPAGRLASFSIIPTSVNTVSTSRRVRVTARFTGTQPLRVSASLASAQSTRKTRFEYLTIVLKDHHGRWTGTARLPRWLGKQVLDASLAANWGTGYSPSSRFFDTDSLSRRHFPTRVSVTSGVDRTAPKLTSLSLSPDPIDSTAGDERVTVTATVTDTGSGVQYVEVNSGIRNGLNGAATGAYPYAKAGIGYTSSQNFDVRLKRTAKGIWVGTTTVRQCVPSGTYKLNAELRDVAGNYRSYSTKQLAQAHITSTVEVTSKHGDVVPPYVYSAATYSADRELFLNFSEGVERVNTSTLTVFALSPADTRYQSPTSIAAVECSNGTTTVDCSGSGGLVTSAVLTIPDLEPGDKYEVWANLHQTVPQLTDGNRNPLDWNYAAAQVLAS